MCTILVDPDLRLTTCLRPFLAGPSCAPQLAPGLVVSLRRLLGGWTNAIANARGATQGMSLVSGRAPRGGWGGCVHQGISTGFWPVLPNRKWVAGLYFRAGS
jgi:hypothetical protein